MAQPIICPLYGVVIRDAQGTGDKQLMNSILTVSRHMLQTSKPAYDSKCVDDWQAAQAELEKALG